MNLQLLIEARRLFDACTPLNADCGLLCARACCQNNGDAGYAVALFPGEEELLQKCDWGRVITLKLPASGVVTRALICDNSCERDKRPLCCRIFPLTLAYSHKKARRVARMDRRAFMLCPLATSGVKGLNPAFVRAAEEAARILSADADGERMLNALAAEEKAYHISPF